MFYAPVGSRHREERMWLSTGALAVVAALVVMPCASAVAQTVDTQKQAVDLITNTADKSSRAPWHFGPVE